MQMSGNMSHKYGLSRPVALFIVGVLTTVLLASSFLWLGQMHNVQKPSVATTPDAQAGAQKKPAHVLYIALQYQVLKYDLDKKQVLWHYRLNDDGYNLGITRPIVEDHKVYFSSYALKQTYILDSETGVVREKHQLDKLSGSPEYVVHGVRYLNVESDVPLQPAKVLALNSDGTVKKDYGVIGDIKAVINGIIYTTYVTGDGSFM